MLRLFATLSIALILALPCAADSVDTIRAEWSELSTTSGERLYVVPDVYTRRARFTARETKATAKDFFMLAKRAARLGEVALAIRLATEAVHHDPDCEPARRALGYELHEGEWLTPYQLRKANRGLAWNLNYGWIAPDDLPRYEAGERKVRGRWVTAEVDARRHANIREGWQVRTDHFNVTTNHSLRAGAELAAKLEQLYQVWRQLCGDFHIEDDDLRTRFDEDRVGSSRHAGIRSRPFQVVYHRSQAEYNAALEVRQPRIAETIGIYFDRQREAHFFHPGEVAAATGTNDATLYHEAVHQLFYESQRAIRDPGERDNFWAIEGVATWFESLQWRDDHFTIGERDAGRLPAAKQRLLVEGYRVPLVELVTLGKHDLQARDDLSPLYSQSAGLATFMMATPERRGAFVEYLRQIYAGSAESITLAELTGKSYAQLDVDYRAYLESLPE
ncbi:MAG: hypothetical protein ACR2NU_05295 [Aeoliella sp.]